MDFVNCVGNTGPNALVAILSPIALWDCSPLLYIIDLVLRIIGMSCALPSQMPFNPGGVASGPEQFLRIGAVGVGHSSYHGVVATVLYWDHLYVVLHLQGILGPLVHIKCFTICVFKHFLYFYFNFTGFWDGKSLDYTSRVCLLLAFLHHLKTLSTCPVTWGSLLTTLASFEGVYTNSIICCDSPYLGSIEPFNDWKI